MMLLFSSRPRTLTPGSIQPVTPPPLFNALMGPTCWGCLSILGLISLLAFSPLGFAQPKNTAPSPAKSAPKESTTNSALSAQWMFEILLGEINALEGQAPTAYALILDVAKKSGDEKAFERAIEIALKSRSGEAALEAARAWREAQPNSQSAHQYLVQIFIALNQLNEVESALGRLLLITPKEEKIELIRSIPRQFTRVQNKALAAQIVERVLEGAKANRSLSAAAWSAVGQMKLLNNDQEGAMAAVQKGHQADAQSADPLWLALGLMEMRYFEAENFLQRFFSQKSSSVDAELHFAYAKILLQNQELKPGIEQLLILTKKHPSMPLPWLYLASAQLESDWVAEAKIHFEKFLALQATAPTPMNEREASQAYFGLSQIASQQGDLNKAEEWLSLITHGPSRVSAFVQRALILNKKGQAQSAIDLILTLPEDTSAERKSKNTALAQIYRDQKNFTQALEVLKAAFKQSPKDDDVTYELAMAYEKLNRLDEMELALKAIIQRNPNYHAALNALGYSLADRNLRLPQAREYIVKALEMSPEDPFIMDSLGWVEFKMGKLKEALAILKRAYAIKPDADIAAHLGEVMYQLGLKEEAIQLWHTALDKSPGNEVLQETLKRLGIKI
jgi:tetratricopeptide (TPR) repeat protein